MEYLRKRWWLGALAWIGFLCVVVTIVAWYVPYRPDFAFTRLSFYEPTLAAKLPPAVWVWANFDGVHYLHKATSTLFLEPRFLPLYPLLISVLSLHFWHGSVMVWPLIAALGISWGALCSAIFLLYNLIRSEYSHEVALWTVVLLLSFPTSFFFAGMYTESLFLCVAVGALWYARKSRWGTSFFLISVASMIRLPGILLVVPILFSWTQWMLREKRVITFSKILPVGLIFLPLLTMMVLLWQQTGDPLIFVHAHGALANGRATASLVFPAVTVWRYGSILFSVSPFLFEWWIALFELASVTLAGFSLYWMVRLKLPVMYLLYSVCMLFLPVFSGTFTGFPRYLVVVFPVFLVLAHAPKAVRWGVLGVFLLLQVVLVSFFSRGYFVA